MITQLKKQEKRRSTILEGLSRNLKTSDIASQLNVDEWVILNDIKKMKYHKDPELRQAYETANRRKREKKKFIATRDENTFQDITGMTLQEKSFRNMLHYYKPELLDILNSEDENLAIQKLSSSDKRCLRQNGIITPKLGKSELTLKARECLSDPDHKIWEKNTSK